MFNFRKTCWSSFDEICPHQSRQAHLNALSAFSLKYIMVVRSIFFRNLRLSFNYYITVYLYAEVTGQDDDRGLLSERTGRGGSSFIEYQSTI